MINLDELKSVLEGLDLSADTIEAIQGLDREVVDNSDEINRLQIELDNLNASWNQRFKDAFFKGVPHDKEVEVTEQVDMQAGGEIINEPTTYEDLFKEEI